MKDSNAEIINDNQLILTLWCPLLPYGYRYKQEAKLSLG